MCGVGWEHSAFGAQHRRFNSSHTDQTNNARCLHICQYPVLSQLVEETVREAVQREFESHRQDHLEDVVGVAPTPVPKTGQGESSEGSNPSSSVVHAPIVQW